MRIIVEGVKGEGVTTIARMVQHLLSSAYIPVDNKYAVGICPTIVRRVRKVAERLEAPIEIDTKITSRWTEHLFIDPEAPEEGPMVKGTLVTVRHVVSLIVDGWTWKDILRTHPELCEDDIRACLSYSVEQEGEKVNRTPEEKLLEAVFGSIEED